MNKTINEVQVGDRLIVDRDASDPGVLVQVTFVRKHRRYRGYFQLQVSPVYPDGSLGSVYEVDIKSGTAMEVAP